MCPWNFAPVVHLVRDPRLGCYPVLPVRGDIKGIIVPGDEPLVHHAVIQRRDLVPGREALKYQVGAIVRVQAQVSAAVVIQVITLDALRVSSVASSVVKFLVLIVVQTYLTSKEALETMDLFLIALLILKGFMWSLGLLECS